MLLFKAEDSIKEWRLIVLLTKKLIKFNLSFLRTFQQFYLCSWLDRNFLRDIFWNVVSN